MDIERHDDHKERREYESKEEMLADAEKEAQNPNVKRLTLHFPKMRIPSRRRHGRQGDA